MKRDLLEIHGMDPNYTESEEKENFAPCQTPHVQQISARSANLRNIYTMCSTNHSENIRNIYTMSSTIHPAKYRKRGCQPNQNRSGSVHSDGRIYEGNRPFRQHMKTPSVAEPNLPQTQDPANFAHAIECDLPGPMSRDDDEDSSPLVQDLIRRTMFRVRIVTLPPSVMKSLRH